MSLLKDFSSRELERRVLDRGFEKSLDVVEKSFEEYVSIDLGGLPIYGEEMIEMSLIQATSNANSLL